MASLVRFTQNRLSAVLLVLASLTLLGACQKEEAKAPVAPPKPVFDMVKAEQAAKARFKIEEAPSDDLAFEPDYLQIATMAHQDQASLQGALDGLVDPDAAQIVLLLHPQYGPDFPLPSVPLIIFEKVNGQWQTAFQAEGAMTPVFVARRAPLSLSLELVSLASRLENLPQDAQGLLETYSKTPPLLSKERGSQIAAQADSFLQRISLVQLHSSKNLLRFDLPFLENRTASLVLTTPQGAEVLSNSFHIVPFESLLSLNQGTPPAYAELRRQNIGGTTIRAALGDLEAGFWTVPNEARLASCQAIFGALNERMGLSRKDSARVLWRLIQTHAVFADDVDYEIHCTGSDIAFLMTNSALALPPTDSSRPSSTKRLVLNRTMSEMARLMKTANPASESKLVQMMADHVQIRDGARFFFANENQLITAPLEVVAPAATAQQAASYLMTLPMEAYGCYASGAGQLKNHRATLIEIENDRNLWLLNLAFDENDKISGLHFHPATQLQYCRAINGRAEGNPCIFEKKTFENVSTDRCG